MNADCTGLDDRIVAKPVDNATERNIDYATSYATDFCRFTTDYCQAPPFAQTVVCAILSTQANCSTKCKILQLGREIPITLRMQREGAVRFEAII